ncbi:MAG: hypothetical protein LAP21_11750 [Acidobacteriia bacterium]|nr:hypothetical protein [Terriglobia bacterium]
MDANQEFAVEMLSEKQNFTADERGLGGFLQIEGRQLDASKRKAVVAGKILTDSNTDSFAAVSQFTLEFAHLRKSVMQMRRCASPALRGGII